MTHDMHPITNSLDLLRMKNIKCIMHFNFGEPALFFSSLLHDWFDSFISRPLHLIDRNNTMQYVETDIRIMNYSLIHFMDETITTKLFSINFLKPKFVIFFQHLEEGSEKHYLNLHTKFQVRI